MSKSPNIYAFCVIFLIVSVNGDFFWNKSTNSSLPEEVPLNADQGTTEGSNVENDKVDCAEPPTIPFAKLEMTSTTHGSYAIYAFQDPYKLIGYPRVQCLFGEWIRMPRYDGECVLECHNCGPGFSCRNLQGSFRCDRVTCPPGQTLLSDGSCKVIVCGTGMEPDDAGNCIDIDECERQIYECGPQQTCRNHPGGYTCECPHGYSLNLQRECEAPLDITIEEIETSLKNEQFDGEKRKYVFRDYAQGRNPGSETLEITKNSRLIMHFAFDVSGSIHVVNFKKGIEFAKAIVEKIQVSEDGARAGALVFSNDPVDIFFPMDFKTTEEVLVQLDNIEYFGGGTDMTSALHRVIDNIKLVEYQREFKEKNLTHVLFLITDGKASRDDSPDIEAETLKKDMNVEIFCIGITGDVRAETLYQIASTSKDGNDERPNVFILKNYERLNWLIQDLFNGTIDYGQCGLGMESKMNRRVRRMIGGEAAIEPWPWMATLFFRDPNDNTEKPVLKCGGSIINGNFILTAAHCLFENTLKLEYRRKTAEEIIVKLGLVELKNETLIQEFQVEELYIHKDYLPGSLYDNDIALLTLDRPIVYGPFVRPVCLPPAVLPEDDNYPLYKPNEIGWVIGFGHEKKVKLGERVVQYKLSKQLKELSLPIQSNLLCRESLKKAKDKESFTERMFCAGDGASGNDTCKGDSGGPFMQPQMDSQGQLYWTQVGILSWGIGCGNKGRYGYYTHVQKFRGWIDETIKIVLEEDDEKK